MIRLLIKVFMWLGNGLFGKCYWTGDPPTVIMWARTVRDANNAMRDWVDGLDAGAKWSPLDEDELTGPGPR